MFRQILLLAGRGVPWSEIMSWSEARRLAAVVAIGEMQGREFDWGAGRWVDP